MDRIPTWAWAVTIALGAFGILFFFQTKDPMILILSVIAAGVILAVVTLIPRLSGGAMVRIKCRACAGLNVEDAKFCAHCGQPI